MEPLVVGVDHVYIPLEQAATAFAVLTRGLGLPALWPFTSFGSFSSGGISLGSIKLELIESNAVTPWSVAGHPPRIQGVAFRPSAPVDAAYLRELDDRGIAHTDPETFERDGRPAWTNVYFTDLVGPGAGGFVCDYHLPESKDLARRRQVLTDCDGGRLGVVDAAELAIASPAPPAAARRWERLLGPPDGSDGPTWSLPLGPALRIVEGDADCVDHLTLTVHDAVLAGRVWREVAEPALSGLALRWAS